MKKHFQHKTKMSYEEINKAIAEHCGVVAQPYFRRTIWIYGGEMHYSPPDYTHDLNLIRDAAISQGDDFQPLFAMRLAQRRTGTLRMHHQLSAKDWSDVFLLTMEDVKISQLQKYVEYKTDAGSIKSGSKVKFANSEFEVAEVKFFPHGPMIGIYDEPPSKHIDYLRPESVTLIEP